MSGSYNKFTGGPYYPLMLAKLPETIQGFLPGPVVQIESREYEQ